MNIFKSKKAITLISLVVTIVIIVILAAVAINVAIGNNGLFSKAKEAKENMKKAEASEKMNMKITEAQINSYAETGKLPTLKQLGIFLQADNEIEYAQNTTKKRVADGNFDWSSIGEPNVIYTKLKKYPYEFGIDSEYKLASIDGIQVSSTNNSNNEELQTKINELEGTIATLNSTIQEMSTTINSIQTTLESTYAKKSDVTSNSVDYSNTAETVIGKSYDGKTLYEKSISFTIPTTSKDGTVATTTVDLTTLNANNLWIAEGFFIAASGMRCSLPEYVANNADLKMYSYYHPTEKKLYLKNSYTGFNGQTGYATIHYTKNN